MKRISISLLFVFLPNFALACVQDKFSWGYFLNLSIYGLYIKLSMLAAVVIFLIMFKRNKIALAIFVILLAFITLWLLVTTLLIGGLKC